MKRTNFRRRAEGVTDYRKRLNLLKSGKTRLVVRNTINNITAQLVDYVPSGDKVLTTVDVVFLRKQGWKCSANVPAAYLIGYELGKRAKKLKIEMAILDMGRLTHSSKTFAVVKGALDAGFEIPHSVDVFPSQSRIEGKHIDSYMKNAKGHQFSKYKSEKISVEKNFKEVLAKLKGEKDD